MRQDIRSQMAQAGFTLFNESEPGIYVRQADTKDFIDWTSEPTELIERVRLKIDLPQNEVETAPTFKSDPGIQVVLG